MEHYKFQIQLNPMSLYTIVSFHNVITYIQTYINTYIHTYIQKDRQTDRHIHLRLIIKWIKLNCFCSMVDQRSWDHYQRSSQLQISDMPWAGFEPAQNLRSGCAVVTTTITVPIMQRTKIMKRTKSSTKSHFSRSCYVFSNEISNESNNYAVSN